MDGIVALSLLQRRGKDRRKHLQTRTVLELRIQCRSRCVRFVLGDLCAIVVTLLRGLFAQVVLWVVSGPWGEIGRF